MPYARISLPCVQFTFYTPGIDYTPGLLCKLSWVCDTLLHCNVCLLICLVFLQAEGHSLLGGPVDALIAHAAADQKHESDRLYHEAFLLTYRTFVEPDVLIEKLLERHDVFLEAGNDVICHATLSLLLRVVDEIRYVVLESRGDRAFTPALGI